MYDYSLRIRPRSIPSEWLLVCPKCEQCWDARQYLNVDGCPAGCHVGLEESGAQVMRRAREEDMRRRYP